MEEMTHKAAMQLNALEECLTSSIHDNVRNTRASRRVDQAQEAMHNGWLKYLQTYCCETQGLNLKGNHVKSDIINANLPDYMEQKQTVVHRKINFDQVQTAIMTLVKEITADLRRRSWRKRLSEETIKRSLSCEMINKLSPSADHTSSDILSLFDNAIIYEEQDPAGKEEPVSSEEEDEEAFVSTEPYSMEILHSDVDHLKSESYQYVINSLRHSSRTSHSTSSVSSGSRHPFHLIQQSLKPEYRTRSSHEVIYSLRTAE